MDDQRVQPSRRKRILRVGAVCALIGAVLLIAWPRGPKEPEYQGMKLSEWIRELPAESVIGVLVEPSDPAVIAVRAMGTNSVPFLVKWIDCDLPNWQRRLVTIVSFNSFVRDVFGRKEARAYRATAALELLGPDAKFAVPELARRLGRAPIDNRPNHHLRRTLVSLSQRKVDISAAAPTILRVEAKLKEAFDADKSGRSWNVPAYFCWFYIGPNCVQTLTNSVFSEDLRVRDAALRHLQYLSQVPGGYAEKRSPEDERDIQTAAKFLYNYAAIGTNAAVLQSLK